MKDYRGAEKMVKCLLYKHENQSSDPYHSRESRACRCMPETTGVCVGGNMDTGVSWGLINQRTVPESVRDHKIRVKSD